MRLTQGPTFFICGVVISARQKFALVFSLIFSLNTLLPAVSLWYGLVQRNAPNPCSTRLSGIVWYGLVGPDMAFGQILSFLEDFCRREGVSEIVVQMVETSEMANWCLKNGFQPIPSATMAINGFLIGDYRKEVF